MSNVMVRNTFFAFSFILVFTLLISGLASAGKMRINTIPEDSTMILGNTYRIDVVADSTDIPLKKIRGSEWDVVVPISDISFVSSSLPSSDDFFEGLTMHSTDNVIDSTLNGNVLDYNIRRTSSLSIGAQNKTGVLGSYFFTPTSLGTFNLQLSNVLFTDTSNTAYRLSLNNLVIYNQQFVVVPAITNPSISFVPETEENNALIGDRNNIQINVSSEGLNLTNITIRLYDSEGMIRTDSTNNDAQNLFVNYTHLLPGEYWFNASVYDSNGNSNHTETRSVEISHILDTSLPIFFTSITEDDGASLTGKNIRINAYSYSSYLKNITIRLYDSNGLVASNSTNSDKNGLYVYYQNLPEGDYKFNATAYDIFDNQNSTETREVYVGKAQEYSSFVKFANWIGSTPFDGEEVYGRFAVNIDWKAQEGTYCGAPNVYYQGPVSGNIYLECDSETHICSDTLSPILPDGTYTIQGIYYTSEEGGYCDYKDYETSTLTINVVSEAPTTSYNFPTPLDGDIGFASGRIYVSGTDSNIDSATLTLDGNDYEMICSNDAPNYSCYYDYSNLIEGNSYTFEAKIRDSDGNIASAGTRTFVADSNKQGIDECGILDKSDGIYLLRNSIDSEGSCFSFPPYASNITLDGNGNTINGNGEKEGKGIDLNNEKFYSEGITLKNLNINNFYYGIFSSQTISKNLNIEDVVVSDSSYMGISLTSECINCNLNRVQSLNSGERDLFVKMSNSIISDSIFSGAKGNYGVLISGTLRNGMNIIKDVSFNGHSFLVDNSPNVLIEGVDISSSGYKKNNLGTLMIRSSSNVTLENVNFLNNLGNNDLYLNNLNGIMLNNTIVRSYSFLNSILDFRIGNSDGEIRFLENISGTGQNLSSEMVIGHAFAYVNSSKEGMNKPARISLYNIHEEFVSPAIFKDGVVCSECNNLTSLDAETVIFNVESWSNYSIGENSDSENNILEADLNLDSESNSVQESQTQSSGSSGGNGGSSSSRTNEVIVPAIEWPELESQGEDTSDNSDSVNDKVIIENEDSNLFSSITGAVAGLSGTARNAVVLTFIFGLIGMFFALKIRNLIKLKIKQ